MPLTTTPSCLLHQALVKLYMGKTILCDPTMSAAPTYIPIPFTVGRVEVNDNGPDGWDVCFKDSFPGCSSYPGGCKHSRTVGMGKQLPEIWPEVEEPLSPCS